MPRNEKTSGDTRRQAAVWIVGAGIASVGVTVGAWFLTQGADAAARTNPERGVTSLTDASLAATSWIVTSTEDGDPELFLVTSRFDTLWTRVTNAPGLDNGASWSPDGRRVVFHSERGTAGRAERELDIYTVEVGEPGSPPASPVRLTDEPGHDYLPQFSPDGSRIAFLSRRPEPSFPTGSPGQIYIMNADGSDPRPIGLVPIDASLGPTWHPDGNSIFIARRLFELGPTTLSRVWLDFDAPEGQPLGVEELVMVADSFFNYTPHASPDGARMAWTAETAERSRVAVMNMDGTGQRFLTDDGHTYVEGWTPDGSWIVATRWFPAFQRRETWLVSPDSAGVMEPLFIPAHRPASAAEFRPGAPRR